MDFVVVLRMALVALGLGLSTTVFAWVEVCNGRSETVMAAVALADRGPANTSQSHPGVSVEGWWRIAPGKCAVASEGDARESWLYFHARSSGGRFDGEPRLCVRNKPFTSRQQFLRRDEHCRGEWSDASFVRRESSEKNYRFTVH